jgi:hypothetical protein
MSSGLIVRAATVGDVLCVAERLRETDLAELRGLRPNDRPADVLLYGLRHGVTCDVLTFDDEPLAIFGLAPTANADMGIPWMMGTDGLNRRRKVMLRMGRFFVRKWLEVFPCLVNIVLATSTENIRYIKRLGFEVGGPQSSPAYDHAFCVFHMTRSRYHV